MQQLNFQTSRASLEVQVASSRRVIHFAGPVLVLRGGRGRASSCSHGEYRLRGYYRSVGGGDYLPGEWGWGGSFKMPFSLTRQPRAPPCVAFARSVTHPLISQSVSSFFLLRCLSLVFLTTHSGGQTHQDAGEEVETGENRSSKLLVLEEKER